MNPSENQSQHNYTGYPQYNAKGPNALFTSNDAGYQYTTELSDSSSAVEFTYNSLHLLISQKVLTRLRARRRSRPARPRSTATRCTAPRR